MGKVKIPKSEYSKIADLYQSGISQVEIANIYNVCRDTIAKILKNNCVDRFKKIKESEYKNIIEMYNNGMTQREIGNTYGVKQSFIATIIKNNDPSWKIRRGKTPLYEEADSIIKMYVSGMTETEIAKIYDCSASAVSSILIQENISTRNGGSMNTQDVIEKMQLLYINGMQLKDIASKFNTTYPTVSRLLKQQGVNIDRYTYHFNEHYFDNIDSQYKAYILGLLWADGCNVTNKNSIIISLQEKDKGLLEIINVLTENERPLKLKKLHDKNPKWQNCYTLVWQSKYLSSLLESYGMVNNKSLFLRFPDWLDKNLYSHFIRGYFDGDGCISLSKNNNNRSASINMVGTRMFLEEVSKIIKNETDIDVFIKRDERANDPICILRCGIRNDVINILDWLYSNAQIYMQRKYDKYQQFLNNINNSCCA